MHITTKFNFERAGRWAQVGVRRALKDSVYLALKETGIYWSKLFWPRIARAKIDRPKQFTLRGAFASRVEIYRSDGDVHGGSILVGLKNLAARRNKRPPAKYLLTATLGGRRYARIQPIGKTYSKLDAFGNIKQRQFQAFYDYVRRRLRDGNLVEQPKKVKLLGQTFAGNRVVLFSRSGTLPHAMPRYVADPIRVVFITRKGGQISNFETIAVLKTKQSFRKTLDLSTALSPLRRRAYITFLGNLRRRLRVLESIYSSGAAR